MKASKYSTVLPVSLLVSALTVMAGAAHAQATGPKAEKGFNLSVFARAFGNYSAPDSIAVADGHVFIGYGNGNLPDGSDGESSNYAGAPFLAQRADQPRQTQDQQKTDESER